MLVKVYHLAVLHLCDTSQRRKQWVLPLLLPRLKQVVVALPAVPAYKIKLNLVRLHAFGIN